MAVADGPPKGPLLSCPICIELPSPDQFSVPLRGKGGPTPASATAYQNAVRSTSRRPHAPYHTRSPRRTGTKTTHARPFRRHWAVTQCGGRRDKCRCVGVGRTGGMAGGSVKRAAAGRRGRVLHPSVGRSAAHTRTETWPHLCRALVIDCRNRNHRSVPFRNFAHAIQTHRQSESLQVTAPLDHPSPHTPKSPKPPCPAPWHVKVAKPEPTRGAEPQLYGARRACPIEERHQPSRPVQMWPTLRRRSERSRARRPQPRHGPLTTKRPNEVRYAATQFSRVAPSCFIVPRRVMSAP